MELKKNINYELVDTHCHLDAYKEDLPDIIKRAESSGIKRIITIGTDKKTSIKAIDLAKKYKNIYAAIGVHPHDAKEFTNDTKMIFKELAKSEKVIAIGEIGLDYHYDNSPRQIQQKVFATQLELAKELQLPVIIHSRDAKVDTLSFLKNAGKIKGLMHCFSGDIDMLEQVISLELFISFAGNVTFKNAKELHEIVKIIPDEYILIETDAPYLTPVPLRGKRNEPSYLIYIAEKIASLRGVSVEDIARITTINAKRLFDIGELPKEGNIAYKIRNTLYLNITNRCSNVCIFCVRFHTDYVKGHKLRLTREPTIDELKEAIGDPCLYKEVVFCGYGEPFIRFDIVKELSLWIKQKGGKVRINTNGHGCLINKRNILPEISGLVDSISISLNAQDEETYKKICRPLIKDAYKGVIQFIKESKKYIPEVRITVVDIEGVDIVKCKEIAEQLGVDFMVRKLDIVG